MSNMLLWKSKKIASERIKRLGQSGNDALGVTHLGVKVTSGAVNSTVQELGMFGP